MSTIEATQTMDSASLCRACILGKHHVSYNRVAPKRSTEHLFRVHMDLSGRLPQSKSSGAQYYLLFIDDMTCIEWVYFLKSKQKLEVQKVFEDFRSMVEKQNPFGGKIKRIRADNGEFDNSILKEVFSKLGLIFEPAPPYTQSMNGVSER